MFGPRSTVHRGHPGQMAIVADNATSTTLRTREAAGLGVMELVGPNALEATWQYTMAKSVTRLPFVHAVSGTIDGWRLKRRPNRNAVLAAAHRFARRAAPRWSHHRRFAKPASRPQRRRPSVRLWRLGRFARPHAVMICIGFALHARQHGRRFGCPVYHDPVINNVLSPRENGLPVKFDVVPWYLAALFGAAVLAWLLSWAKTYVLARQASKSAPTCATIRTHTCNDCRSNSSAASAPAI